MSRYTIERTTCTTGEKDYFHGILLDCIMWGKVDGDTITYDSINVPQQILGLLIQSNTLGSVDRYFWRVLDLDEEDLSQVKYKDWKSAYPRYTIVDSYIVEVEGKYLLYFDEEYNYRTTPSRISAYRTTKSEAQSLAQELNGKLIVF